MGVGPVRQTLLLTGLSEWELGSRHAERSPIQINEEVGVEVRKNACDVKDSLETF